MIEQLQAVPRAINTFYKKHPCSSALLRTTAAVLAFPSLLLVFPEAVAFLLIVAVSVFTDLQLMILSALLFVLYASLLAAVWPCIIKNQPTSAQFVLICLAELMIIVPMGVVLIRFIG